ncbi:MFS transporter [Massilia antarctica]|uniref:MFS transporter n=1 Tax=Massilia antarctica TaxID=2765360 RepID=A0AA48WME2_9BURK|nr:MFS transporter [Massilia antarctica]QPI53215.1 MFS transporter [Massilia antarctica]
MPAPDRHRWKVLGVGVAANASFAAAFAGIPAAAVMLRSAYALSDAALGLALGLMGLGIACSEFPWGVLTDRWGDRKVLLTGLGGTAAALLLMALWAAPGAHGIPGLGLVGAGLLLVGLLGGSVNGSSGRAVMVWFGSAERGMAMSIRQTAVPLGGALGALVLPALARQAGFGAVYGLLSALCAISLLLTWRWLRDPDTAAAPAGSAAGPVPPPSPDRARLWAMVGAIGILCAPQFGILSFGTVFLHDLLGAGVGATTAAMVALQCGAMAMRVWSGRWTDRHGNRAWFLRAAAWGSVLCFVMLGLVSLLLAPSVTERPPLLALAMVALTVSGVCVSAWHGVAYAELVTLAGAGRAGTALGMANTSVFVACFATSSAIPHINALAGWVGVWLVGAACAAAALPLFARSARVSCEKRAPQTV